MVEENEQIRYNSWMSWHKITGQTLAGPAPIELDSVKVKRNGGESVDRSPELYRYSRPRFHLMLCRQLEKTGLKIEYGKRVVEYFEDVDAKTAGVVVDDGERIQADVILAADGIGSKSSRIAMGAEAHARPTGFSIYRAAFPMELAMADPMIRDRFKLSPGGTPLTEVWMGFVLHTSFSVLH